MSKFVIVYGFENEWKIYFKKDSILCKNFNTNLPVYAAPFIIEEIDINVIIEKIKDIEFKNPDLFLNINKLAKERGQKASWKIVLYGNDLKFNTGYESEGDENGDGR